MPKYFCPICGVWMRQQTAIATIPALAWLQEIRIVRSVSDIESPYLTGVGFLVDDFAQVPLEPEKSFNDEEVDLARFQIFNLSQTFWAFPLHDACWGLLLSRLDNPMKNFLQVANHLFRVLLSLYGTNYFSIDFGDANKSHTIHGNPFHEVENTPEAFIHVDPLSALGVDALPEWNDPLSVEWSSPRIHGSTEYSSNHDTFSTLPLEILYEILTSLPSKSVASLRLSSKTVARASTMNALPSRFWQSRFFADFEMGFAFSLLTGIEPKPDWRKRYFQIQTALFDGESYQHLKNRSRIWSTMGRIVNVIRLLEEGGGLAGKQVYWTDLSSVWSSNSSFRVGQTVTADLESNMSVYEPRIRNYGQELAVFGISLPGISSDQGYYLGISLISFSGRTYLSGLRIFNSNETLTEISSLGLVVRNAEILHYFEPGDQLLELEIATTSTGIVGLKFITNKYSRQVSTWHGDIGCGMPEVCFSRLVPEYKKQICGFIVGFDACKMVSFGIVESSFEGKGSSEQAELPDLNTPSPSGTISWTPRIPYHLSCTAEQTPFNRCYEVRFNIDFGNPDGKLLLSLTRITAVMDTDIDALVGLEFVYSEGTCALYGRRNGAEKTLFIDGAKGELINSVYVGVGSSTEIMSLKLSTNFRNQLCYENNGLEPLENTILEAPHMETIVGFICKENSRTGSFHSLELICRNVAEDTTQTLQAAVEALPLNPEHILGGRIQATEFDKELLPQRLDSVADLQNVRCIRISHGCAGRSRGDLRVSGLWIDYYHTDQPQIVGQWFHESYSMMLAPDEVVTDVSFWLQPDAVSREAGGPKLGQVVGILISTSASRSISAGDLAHPSHLFADLRTNRPPTRRLVNLKYHASRLEQLTAIHWSFSKRWDQTRVSTIYPGLRSSGLFQPKVERKWRVPEIVLWEDVDNKGDLDRLKGITIKFKTDLITGLVFKYGSGKTRVLGPLDSQQSLEIAFVDNEKVVRVEAGWNMAGLQEMFLTTEREEEHGSESSSVPVQRRLGVRAKEGNGTLNNVDDHDVSKAFLEMYHQRWQESIKSYGLAGAKFAGFWANDSYRRIIDFGVF
ncbi:hypothetical protein G7Y89_g12060 [Cudoniella acicularis]|uniref:F-box domain-containing protein n=1 Tax=Cudoniella acicularis TaxID=354080 RepID=A0A8H4RBY8_9HELO|nr:hypothetical protein G7Y89_g12060 [Cudoniella acicularis]